MRPGRALGYAIGAAVVLISWWAAPALTSHLIPGPAPALEYLASHPIEALQALSLTLLDALAGYAIAAASSLVGLVVCELGDVGEAAVSALREILHSVTPVAWSLALLIIFGFTSRLVPILVSALMGFPPLMTSLLEGLGAARARYGDLAEALRLGGLRRLIYVDLPASIPYLVAGTRSAIGVALISSPVAEAFGTAGGIGYGLYLFFELHEYSAFEAWSALLVVVMVVLDVAILAPLERWSRRWLE
ncbi:MAG: ABC transporter permease [Acidilobus sp.]